MPFGDKRSFKYFKEATVANYAEQYDWELINPANMDFYSTRKEKGLVVEKKQSLYCKDQYSSKDVERNIFMNPFKRFEDMGFMSRCRDIEYVEFNRHVLKRLS